MDENDLLHRFTSGDEDAFKEIYRRLYFRIYSFCKRFLEKREDAEDLTAETFVKLWNRRTSFSEMEQISMFLYVAARNGCLDYLKHLKVQSSRQQELFLILSREEEGDFSTEEIREQLLKLIYAEVDKLPQKMREIFLLSFAEGLKPIEIAKKLNLSVQTVSNQKTTAVKILKAALSNYPLLFTLLVCLELEASIF